MRSIKKISTLSVLSILASQMPTTALTITEGFGEVEKVQRKIPQSIPGVGSFRELDKERKRTKIVNCITVDFESNNKEESKIKLGKLINNNNQADIIISAIRNGILPSDSNSQGVKEKDIEWVVLSPSKTKPQSTKKLFKFENVSRPSHIAILSAFFKEGIRDGEEVHITSLVGNRGVVTPDRVEFYDASGSHIKMQGVDSKDYTDALIRSMLYPTYVSYELTRLFYDVDSFSSETKPSVKEGDETSVQLPQEGLQVSPREMTHEMIVEVQGPASRHLSDDE